MIPLALACTTPAELPAPPSDALLIRAREVVDGAEARPIPGDVEVRVCAWDHGPRACATGQGEHALDAVELAASRLPAVGARDRLGIDLVLDEREAPAALPPRERARRAWRAGGELLTAPELLVLPPADALEPAELGLASEVEVASWIEGLDGRPTALDGAWARQPPALGPEVLEAGARAAAAWLAAAVQDDGRFRYERHPGQPPSTAYNWLRHAGATAVLFDAARQLDHPGWGTTAERALGALLAQTVEVDDTELLIDDDKAKLGGNGLALLALARHHAWHGASTHLETARALGQGLLDAQLTDGSFVAFRSPEGLPLEGSSLYYPGEAILGLLELAAWDDDPRWLAAADRGLAHLVESRREVPTEDLPADHWLMIAMDRRHALGGDDALRAPLERLARAIEGQPAPQATNAAATRLEGLLARLETCARVGDLCAVTRLETLDRLDDLVAVQLTRDAGFFLPDDQLVGAFPAAPHDLTCRIDTTQHALSALLGALRVVAL